MRSVPDPGFDQRIADWLEGNPDHAPATVLETVAAAVPSISQRHSWRIRRRFPTMLRVAVAATAVLLTVSFAAILFTGGSNGPATATTSPAPTITPWPSSALATFVSPKHGYQISYPATWTVRPATAPWPIGVQAAAFGDPMVDLFKDPAAASTDELDVVSQPLGEIITPDAWLVSYEASNPSMPTECWPAPGAMDKLTVDSQPAYVHGGLAQCGFTEAVVFAGGRVYEFSAYFQPGGTPMLSRPLFDQLMASVKLDPATADDSPAQSTPGPASPSDSNAPGALDASPGATSPSPAGPSTPG